MTFFLCNLCDDVNCGIIGAPFTLFGVIILPECVKMRNITPNWQEYTKTVDLFRDCKDGSVLEMTKLCTASIQNRYTDAAKRHTPHLRRV